MNGQQSSYVTSKCMHKQTRKVFSCEYGCIKYKPAIHAIKSTLFPFLNSKYTCTHTQVHTCTHTHTHAQYRTSPLPNLPSLIALPVFSQTHQNPIKSRSHCTHPLPLLPITITPPQDTGMVLTLQLLPLLLLLPSPDQWPLRN